MWVVAIALTLIWGAAAFGSNYPWAYRPLLAACAVLGAVGLLIGRSAAPTALCTGLVSIALATAMQLAPLPTAVVQQLSPASHAIQRDYNLLLALDTSSPLTLSIEHSRTQLGLLFFGSFALLAVGSARVITRHSARTAVGAITAIGAALATFGIIQHATFDGKIYGLWELPQGGSPFGPFVNKNHFAGWMVMATPLALGLFSSAVSRGMRGINASLRDRMLWFSSPEASKSILVGFAVLTMTLALVLTMSRSGMVSLGVAFLAAAVLMARRQSNTPRRAIVGGYLVIVAVLVVSWVGMETIAVRFASFDATAINQRPAMWSDTLRIARDFWLTGTGLNTYGVSTLYYQTSIPESHLREAHNDYLQLAAEGGLLLGIPIICTIAAFATHVRRRFQQDEGSIWWIRMGAVTGIFAIAVQSLAEFSLQMPGNAAIFSVLCGIALHDGRRV